MKRVLRSALDPLPRALSMQSLVGLVAAVVLGIAVTVVLYVESSRPTDGRAPTTSGSSSDVRAAGPSWHASGTSGGFGSTSGGSGVANPTRRGIEAMLRLPSGATSAAPSSTTFSAPKDS